MDEIGLLGKINDMQFMIYVNNLPEDYDVELDILDTTWCKLEKSEHLKLWEGKWNLHVKI